MWILSISVSAKDPIFFLEIVIPSEGISFWIDKLNRTGITALPYLFRSGNKQKKY